MKKILFIFLSILIIACSLFCVFAADYDYTPPSWVNSTPEITGQTYLYTSELGMENIGISYETNEEGFYPSSMTAAEVALYSSGYEKSIKEGYESNGMIVKDIKTSTATVKKIGNYDCVYLDIESDLVFENDISTSLRQTMTMYASKEHLYILVLTTISEDHDKYLPDFLSSLDTFVINEELPDLIDKTQSSIFGSALIRGISYGATVGIIALITGLFTKSKKKKKKAAMQQNQILDTYNPNAQQNNFGVNSYPPQNNDINYFDSSQEKD